MEAYLYTTHTPSWRGRGNRILLVLVILYVGIAVFVVLCLSLFILFPLNMLQAVHRKFKNGLGYRFALPVCLHGVNGNNFKYGKLGISTNNSFSRITELVFSHISLLYLFWKCQKRCVYKRDGYVIKSEWTVHQLPYMITIFVFNFLENSVHIAVVIWTQAQLVPVP